jgi:hypothetical protein
MISILATISISLGALIALSNWYCIYASHRTGRHVPPAPLLGGLLLVLGLVGFPETRAYAWLGIVADYGTVILIFAVPVLIWDAWSTSSMNLVHRLVGDSGGRRDHIRLLKQGKFTIRTEHDPPVPCNEHGALAVSRGFVGVWREESRGFVLEGYGGDRILWILPAEGVNRTREENYPEEQEFPVDRLDSLELKKVK